MKKIFALSLLAVGNLTAVSVLAWLVLWFSLVTMSASLGVLTGICVFTALGFAVSLFYGLFSEKYVTSPKRFLLFSYFSPAIFSAIYWIIFLMINLSGIYQKMNSDLGSGFMGYLILPASVFYLIFGVIWYKTVTDPDNENSENSENNAD